MDATRILPNEAYKVASKKGACTVVCVCGCGAGALVPGRCAHQLRSCASVEGVFSFVS